jgi:hypothetical protein
MNRPTCPADSLIAKARSSSTALVYCANCSPHTWSPSRCLPTVVPDDHDAGSLAVHLPSFFSYGPPLRFVGSSVYQSHLPAALLAPPVRPLPLSSAWSLTHSNVHSPRGSVTHQVSVCMSLTLFKYHPRHLRVVPSRSHAPSYSHVVKGRSCIIPSRSYVDPGHA